MSGTARPPLPLERPRFPAGTSVGGRKVGGQYMSDSIIAAAREGMVTQDELDAAQKTIEDQQQQLDQVQKELQDQQQQLDQTQKVIDQQPSRMQRLARVASRTIAPIRALGPLGVLRNINRAASTGRSLINFDLMDNRRVAEATGFGFPRTSMVGAGGGIGTGAERVLFSISRDAAASRATLGRIETAINKIAGEGSAFGTSAPRDSKDDKKDSNWLTALVAAGAALLTTFNTLKTGIDRLVGVIGNLASLLGRTLISGLTSLLSPTGIVGRALITGAQLLFSGPGLAAVIGAGALAAIGSAIIRAMSMSPEERAAAQMRAEEQAQRGREETGATPAGNPGQAAARGIARSYNISTREYGDIQDILINPRQGETQDQRTERERLSELQRQAERNAPGGNVQLAPGVADYIARVRTENAERDIEAGTAENRAIAQSLDPSDIFRAPPNAEAQGEQPSAEPQRARETTSRDQAAQRQMQPANERVVMINNATRRNDTNTVNLIESYAAMRRISRPTGGVIQDGKVVAVLDSRRNRVDVTDLSRRDFSNLAEGDWSGTVQSPELAPPVNDNRSQTITSGSNQPTTVVVNNLGGGNGQTAAAAPPPTNRNTGTAAVGRSSRQPTHPPRPGDVGSAAMGGS